MKEIKFRYWYSGKMIKVGQLDMFTDGSIHVNGELVGGVLMQWTGLKDKNGKEIYEGDILKDCQDIGVVSLGWGDDNERYSDSYGWLQGSHIIGSSIAIKDEIEVIGNIYENPELLK